MLIFKGKNPQLFLWHIKKGPDAGHLFLLGQALFWTCFLAVRKLGRFSLVLPLCNAQNRLLCLRAHSKIQYYVLLTKKEVSFLLHILGVKTIT